jgi:recombinational DNA repair protein (RecF pathway)
MPHREGIKPESDTFFVSHGQAMAELLDRLLDYRNIPRQLFKKKRDAALNGRAPEGRSDLSPS